jgi:CRISPR system Cascade subunit CasE
VFHGAIESSFKENRERNLWRIDNLNGQLYLLILSKTMPDVALISTNLGQDVISGETKDYSKFLSNIKKGDKLRFRITANPTVCVGSENKGERGKVTACGTVEFQKKWLIEKSAKNGFALADNSFDVVQVKWQKFHKRNNKNVVSLLAVSYEGVLEVTDTEMFNSALVNGIGRAKAYGMGLMTVMRVREG